jgi:phage tail-like protein
MAGEKQETPWPAPKFHFKVTIGDYGSFSCQEVSGLDSESDIIEYRAGNNPVFSTIKMPEPQKSSNVALKKGLFQSDSKLFDWLQGLQLNVIKRTTVTIQLLDEAQQPVFTWTLQNAFPVKVTSTDFNAQNNEVAIEELVLAHGGLTIEAV